jgi:hypothetical protein
LAASQSHKPLEIGLVTVLGGCFQTVFAHQRKLEKEKGYCCFMDHCVLLGTCQLPMLGIEANLGTACSNVTCARKDDCETHA